MSDPGADRQRRQPVPIGMRAPRATNAVHEVRASKGIADITSRYANGKGERLLATQFLGQIHDLCSERSGASGEHDIAPWPKTHGLVRANGVTAHMANGTNSPGEWDELA